MFDYLDPVLRFVSRRVFFVMGGSVPTNSLACLNQSSSTSSSSIRYRSRNTYSRFGLWPVGSCGSAAPDSIRSVERSSRAAA